MHCRWPLKILTMPVLAAQFGGVVHFYHIVKRIYDCVLGYPVHSFIPAGGVKSQEYQEFFGMSVKAKRQLVVSNKECL